MKQFWLQFVALTLLIFVGTWATFHPDALNSFLPFLGSSSPTSSSAGKSVVILSSNGAQKVKINVEVANNPNSRAQGLGGRSSIDPNSGMLFVFDSPSQPQFWMKGMKFPLDFIWILGSKVVGTTENAPPPTSDPNEVLPLYNPPSAIDKVIEVNSGFVKAHNIIAGDMLQDAN